MAKKFSKEVESKEVVTKESSAKGRSNNGKRRPQRKPQGSRNAEHVSGHNDSSWYSRSQQLVLDAANLSYSSILGAKMERDANIFDGVYEYAAPSIPGVMALRWAPAYGISTDANSAINVAARRLYSYVRHANSGHSNYDSPDLMIYIMAMDNLYALHAMGLRAYGVARHYQMLNRYVPDTLLKALGFDASIQYNLADFRLALNTLAIKLSAMAVPAEFDIFKRHVWLNSGIYKDSPSEKSQMYVFTPDQLLYYTPVALQTGGSLSVHRFDYTTPLTMAAYVNLFNTFGNPVFGDEDMNIMSGDILKAYGNDAIIRVSTIPEDYFVVPEFNIEVLSQIQNASFHRNVTTGTILEQGGVTQEDNILLFNPTLSGSLETKGNEDYKMFSIMADRPTPEQTMVASRLTFMVDFVDGGFYRLNSIASEWITQAIIYSRSYHRTFAGVESFKDIIYQLNNYKFRFRLPYASDVVVDGNVVITEIDDLMKMLSITKFQCHPIIEIYTSKWVASAADYEYWFRDYLGDIDTYTQITRNTIRKMHDTAILSLLHVEGVFRR